MGSLMAGWDSPVLGDDNKVRARRNRSLTKEEVESFWKQRRKSEDGGEVTSAGTSPFGSLEKTRSSSPLARGGIKVDTDTAAARVEGFLGGGEGEGESPSKSRDWWTRSSWAFLNEPPQEEPDGRSSTSQGSPPPATEHASRSMKYIIVHTCRATHCVFHHRSDGLRILCTFETVGVRALGCVVFASYGMYVASIRIRMHQTTSCFCDE